MDGFDENWQLICWRGAVTSAIRGRRGQTLLKDLLAALDAMPDKRLIAHELQDADGEVCALGALAKARQLDVSKLDPDEPDDVADAFGIAPALAREIVYVNDEYLWSNATPENRWTSVRKWVASQIKTPEVTPV